MQVNGWTLYLHPLLRQQLETLTARVEAVKIKDAPGYNQTPAAKLLATINRSMREIIPRDPGAAAFRQGNALGRDNRHWFRAKFHQRYRLFYRFSGEERIIIYAWVNDERTLRKAGSATDPYAVFGAMLKAGNPPDAMTGLRAAATKLETAERQNRSPARTPAKGVNRRKPRS